ncbi:MAG TPA: signal recognition particle receptor subunit alpha, partial [Actinomycetota bacterium]|nr:signal recognition particle receptor subunit alpha [Actinomycetota bacterium]
MPETLAGSLLATLVIAALGGVSAYVLRRWGDEPAPDPLLSWLEGVMGDVRPALMSGPDDEAAGRRRRWFRRRDAGIESDEQSEEDGGTSPTEAASGTGAIPYAGAISPETQTQSMPAPPGGVEPETARYAERYAREQREQGSERREAEERKPARRRSTRPPGLDHVPFEPGDREAAEEAERTFRDRFRLGLKKTRDYLNRDVREVFGTGPVQESFDDLEEALVRADVGVMAATQLSDELRERGRDLHSDNLMPTLKEHMRALLSD